MNIFPGLNIIINYIWIIPVTFSIHEFEEWNILKWYKKYYRNLPNSTDVSIRIHIVVLALISFLLTFIAYIFANMFLFSLIITLMSAFILLNFFQHIIWTIQLKAYSPGLITGLLCFLAVLFVNFVFIANNLVYTPFYLLTGLIILPLRATLRVNGEMTDEVRNVHLFFIKMEKYLRKIGQRLGWGGF